MKPRASGRLPVQLAVAMAVAGLLAAFGIFNSVVNFPLIFAGICLAVGAFACGATARPSEPYRGCGCCWWKRPCRWRGGCTSQNVIHQSQLRAQARAFGHGREAIARAIIRFVQNLRYIDERSDVTIPPRYRGRVDWWQYPDETLQRAGETAKT